MSTTGRAIYVHGIENAVADCQTDETPAVRASLVSALKALALDANSRVAKAEAELELALADRRAAHLLLDGVTGGPANRRMNDALMTQLRKS
jgi:hypothetical protein